MSETERAVLQTENDNLLTSNRVMVKTLKEAADSIRELSIANLEMRMRLREIESLVDGTEGRMGMATIRFDANLDEIKKAGL